MLRTPAPVMAALLLAAAPMSHAATSSTKAEANTTAPAPIVEKVVYHINDASLARVAMRNIQNHIIASPDARIVVDTHGKGIDFLLNDAKDEKGEPYQTQVAGLKDKGAGYRVCQNTLKGRNPDDSAVTMDATVVPSGVAEIGRCRPK